MLTEDELQGLPENVRAEVKRLQGQVESAEGYVKEIFANPDTRKKLVEINELMPATKKLTIPNDPMDSYVAPLKTKIGELEGQLKVSAEDKMREQVSGRMSELDIPLSDWQKVADFQTSHGINNAISAVELYAKTMDREPEVVNHGPGNSFQFEAAPDEKTAMSNAVTEITNYRKSLAGRR